MRVSNDCLVAGSFDPDFGKLKSMETTFAFRSFCDDIVGTLPDGVFIEFQFSDVGTEHQRALVGGEIPSGRLKQNM
jgi:hypothetical protein